jgi:hypothetical protein
LHCVNSPLKHRARYSDIINGLRYHDEAIAGLVDELLQQKDSLKGSQIENGTKLCRKIAGIKVDLGSNLDKRDKLEKEKINCLEVLRPLISTIKLAKLLPEQDSRTRPSTPPTELLKTSVGDMEIPGSRRSQKRYTVEEVRIILSNS